MALAEAKSWLRLPLEHSSNLFAKVRELSTKVHQRCHYYNVSPASSYLPMSGRLPDRSTRFNMSECGGAILVRFLA